MSKGMENNGSLEGIDESILNRFKTARVGLCHLQQMLVSRFLRTLKIRGNLARARRCMFTNGERRAGSNWSERRKVLNTDNPSKCSMFAMT